MPEMNFGYSGNRDANNADTTNQQPADINGQGDANDPTLLPLGNDGGDNNGETKPKDQNTDDNKDTVLPHDYAIGTKIELENNSYTINDKGDLVDKDGVIFKNANEVKEWMDQYDQDGNNESNITIENLQKAFDIELVDEQDKPIEFENTPDGVKAYVESILEHKQEEIEETVLNTLYDKYPILQYAIPYIASNGGSLDGFTEIKDRSGVTIDDSNETQQENIIRCAWSEQGRKGDIDSYITYLKSQGTLLEVAKEELQALKDSDTELRQQIEKEAQEQEAKEFERLQTYWNGVKKTIEGKTIAGYKIPDTIIINKNGQKISATPNDFFNYLYQTDNNGNSRYEYDLANETPEQRRDNDILRAYLKFTGGTYSNLVDIAINEKEVSKLKLVAKNRGKGTVTITKPQVNSKKTNDFGYGN